MKDIGTAASLRGAVGVKATAVVPAVPIEVATIPSALVDMAMIPRTSVEMAVVPALAIGDIPIQAAPSWRWEGANTGAAPRVIVLRELFKLALAAAGKLVGMCLADLDDVLNFWNELVIFVD